MKIVKIIGGLGNQMFQYAFYLAIKNKFPNEAVFVDCSYFDIYNLHNGFELESVFNITLPKASAIQLKKVTLHINNYLFYRISRRLLSSRKTECIESRNQAFDETVLIQSGDRYYDGYWQNYLYFKDIYDSVSTAFLFKNQLDKKNLTLLNKINNGVNSVSIHVRRGDYLKHRLYKDLCGLEYYKKAIDYIINSIDSPVFFIFSNDIKWAKDNLQPFFNSNSAIFVTGNEGVDSYKDMQLMSLCKHNIIANSSFSWWSAYLNINPDKIVIAPKIWINKDLEFTIQMPEWILF